MNLTLFAKFSLNQDLSRLSIILNESGIAHRFTEELDCQALWVAEETSKTAIDQALARFKNAQNGDINSAPSNLGNANAGLSDQSPAKNNPIFDNFLLSFHLYPLTCVLITLGVVGFFLFGFMPRAALTSSLFFQPMNKILLTGEYWRILTPMFIHFGILHILFNGLWLWVLGRRLEGYLKFNSYFILIVGTAVGGNLLQYFVGKNIGFGGLSGVVFGLMGFLWICNAHFKIQHLFMPSGIFIMMFLFQIIAFSGFFEFFAGMGIANWAHLGGMLAGIGLAFLLIDKNNITNTD